MDHLIGLLALMNDVTDARDQLLLSAPQPGTTGAAVLLDRARGLLKRAAAALARAQWEDASPEPPRRPSDAPRNGNGHSRRRF